jgi:hypothetical protein
LQNRRDSFEGVLRESVVPKVHGIRRAPLEPFLVEFAEVDRLVRQPPAIMFPRQPVIEAWARNSVPHQIPVRQGLGNGMPILDQVKRAGDILRQGEIPVVAFLVSDTEGAADAGDLPATVWGAVPLAIMHLASVVEAEDSLQKVVSGARDGGAKQRLSLALLGFGHCLIDATDVLLS